MHTSSSLICKGGAILTISGFKTCSIIDFSFVNNFSKTWFLAASSFSTFEPLNKYKKKENSILGFVIN